MEKNFECPICGNKDPRFVGYIGSKPYCRKCVSFHGQSDVKNIHTPKNAPIIISYSLSKEQKELSDNLLINYQNGKNTLVNAVCGSGKTEIVLQIISNAIRCGETVGFAVPRRDVAAELFERFRAVFKFNKVVAVYGGHHDKLEGDLIILTTHQLYRYEKYFDLLILDEIDAFPFADNEVLNAMFFRSIRGHFVMLSATPDEKTINYFSQDGYQILSLNKRFHNYPLPVPELQLANPITIYAKLYKILNRFLKETKQVFIFCPTIEICEKVYCVLKPIFHNGDCVHSKKENRSQIIQDFRDKKSSYLVTTAVLERGVTVKDLQVIVFNADNSIYTDAALIQIAGRAGRKKDAPEGRVIYLAYKTTEEIEKSIAKIRSANNDL